MNGQEPICGPSSSDPKDILDWLSNTSINKNSYTNTGSKTTTLSPLTINTTPSTSVSTIATTVNRSKKRDYEEHLSQNKLKPTTNRNTSSSSNPPFKKRMKNDNRIQSTSLVTSLVDLGSKAKVCEQIIDHLFFSHKRTEIYNNKMETLRNELQRKMKNYYNSMAVYGCQVDAFTHFMTQYNSLVWIEEDGGQRIVCRTPALPRDTKVIFIITKHVLLQWNILCNSPWGKDNNGKLDFHGHTLAVLNHMKKGGSSFKLPNRTLKVIPGIAYISHYFPPINDIDMFGFGKNAITTGTSSLTEAYKSINSDKHPIPIDELVSLNNTVKTDDNDESSDEDEEEDEND